MSELRALLRAETRELRLHRRRTALVVSLIAIPVAAITGGTTLMAAMDRAQSGEPSHFEQLVLFVAGGFALAVASLVAAAAFLVSLHRRRREIGLLVALGANRGAMRLAVVSSAAAQGLGGSLLGALLGVAFAWRLHPWIADWAGVAAESLAAFEVSGADLFLAASLGTIAATLAALVPAIAATRGTVTAALLGRRPCTSDASRGGALGGTLLGLGACLLAMRSDRDDAVGGSVLLIASLLVLCGLGVASPAILSALARLAAPLPVAWRLAVRDAGRFRTRHGPAVAAVLSTLAVGILLAALFASVRARAAASGDALGDRERGYLDAILALCAMTAVAVVLVATTLSAAESESDARILHSVGSSPSLLRRLRAARATWLAAIGAWLAVPAGLLPAAGLLAIADVPLVFAVPWRELVIVVIAFPLLVFAFAHSIPPLARAPPIRP